MPIQSEFRTSPGALARDDGWNRTTAPLAGSAPAVRGAGASLAATTPRTQSRAPIPTNLAGLRVHLVGVGGAGMSGAAALLLACGAKVTGSDIAAFPGMGTLVEQGAWIAIGHRAEHLVPGLDLVVASAAIDDANPELQAARAHGLPVMKYAELIAALMRHHEKGIAVAGTHGKSTTTAMCAFLCREAGLSPSFLVGARSRQLGGNSGVGSGPHFIVEACEFDRSFLHLQPAYAAILNVEPDHLDCYRDLDDIVTAFGLFGQNVRGDGLLLCAADDPRARSAAKTAAANVETFGRNRDAHWRAVPRGVRRGCYAFDVLHHGRNLLSTRLTIPGRYNIGNAVAAIALAHHAGADAESIARSLPSFEGVERRLTWRGEGKGVIIVDDYAHHPTEVRVTIRALRQRYRPARLWVLFQPHQYARTRRLMNGFSTAFTGADEVLVADVYGAREQGTPGNGSRTPFDETGDGRACSRELADRIGRNGSAARHVPDFGCAADYLSERACAGDLILTMGAGDIWKVADALVDRLCGKNGV